MQAMEKERVEIFMDVTPYLKCSENATHYDSRGTDELIRLEIYKSAYEHVYKCAYWSYPMYKKWTAKLTMIWNRVRKERVKPIEDKEWKNELRKELKALDENDQKKLYVH